MKTPKPFQFRILHIRRMFAQLHAQFAEILLLDIITRSLRATVVKRFSVVLCLHNADMNAERGGTVLHLFQKVILMAITP
ncbi:hypothetical protein ANCCEY_13596 [Ancylostoma ceylanicum]|uniref:Uncharacterized protein n=2 Tax=Ancylostoma ceylanicum TaxID=53326 RepID=A0A0D6L772_9BILA|nr:hypothetical protein ANCCEY_13596 [Ancylostoma ceylanicum]EYC40080.1 hypothetical protein Y032_0629g837 [Ancylostoma ceylanicum]